MLHTARATPATPSKSPTELAALTGNVNAMLSLSWWTNVPHPTLKWCKRAFSAMYKLKLLRENTGSLDEFYKLSVKEHINSTMFFHEPFHLLCLLHDLVLDGPCRLHAVPCISNLFIGFSLENFVQHSGVSWVTGQPPWSTQGNRNHCQGWRVHPK